jgi:hypothetical protein
MGFWVPQSLLCEDVLFASLCKGWGDSPDFLPKQKTWEKWMNRKVKSSFANFSFQEKLGR